MSEVTQLKPSTELWCGGDKVDTGKYGFDMTVAPGWQEKKKVNVLLSFAEESVAQMVASKVGAGWKIQRVEPDGMAIYSSMNGVDMEASVTGGEVNAPWVVCVRMKDEFQCPLSKITLLQKKTVEQPPRVKPRVSGGGTHE